MDPPATTLVVLPFLSSMVLPATAIADLPEFSLLTPHLAEAIADQLDLPSSNPLRIGPLRNSRDVDLHLG